MKKVFRKINKWSLVALFVSGGVGFALNANANRVDQTYEHLSTQVIGGITYYEVEPTPLAAGSYECNTNPNALCTVTSSQAPDANNRIPANQATTESGNFQQ